MNGRRSRVEHDRDAIIPYFFISSFQFDNVWTTERRMCAFRIFMCNLFTALRCLANNSESVLHACHSNVQSKCIAPR